MLVGTPAGDCLPLLLAFLAEPELDVMDECMLLLSSLLLSKVTPCRVDSTCGHHQGLLSWVDEQGVSAFCAAIQHTCFR
jgi:hypothetical protein